MKGITQPSEGHVKSRPRSSSGSPTKIESRFIIRKVHFYSLRDKKEKIMARMKMKKVSPRSKDQVVLGLSYLFTDVINLNEYTGSNQCHHT